MKTNFTISVFAEGNVGVIVRLTTMILRRRIHISRMTVDTLESENIYQMNMLVHEENDTIRKLVLQIDKQVEVFKTFYNSDEQLLVQEVGGFTLNMPYHSELNNEDGEPGIGQLQTLDF